MILGILQSSSPSVNLTPESSRAMNCIIKCCVKSSHVDILLLAPAQERGKNCRHEVCKAFVHSKCFADCRIPHDNLGRPLSL